MIQIEDMGAVLTGYCYSLAILINGWNLPTKIPWTKLKTAYLSM